MKVIFLFPGLPHYYNYVFNKLNRIDGVKIVNVVPKNSSLDASVFQTKEDIEYKLYQLEEKKTIYGRFFRSFWKIILKERPDIIVTTEPHLKGFAFNLPTVLVSKLFRIPIVLKSIPFRLSRYGKARELLDAQAKETLGKPARRLARLISRPPLAEDFVLTCLSTKFGILFSDLLKHLRHRLNVAYLWQKRYFYRFPDAHVNYVDEAFEIFGSYGVSPDKIFIIRNSPDTDRLLAVRDKLLLEDIDKQAMEHRLIHVGRLVQWKRVDLLLAALSELKMKYDDVELLVIGYGPKAEEWKSLAYKLGIRENVQFLGGVYDPFALGRYLMTSSIYVLAGMGGISINEAALFGLPILCSVCDGTEKYLVRDGVNGLFFREGDAKDLYEKIDYLFTHPEQRSQMGRNSFDIIRNEVNIHTVIDGYMRAFQYVRHS